MAHNDFQILQKRGETQNKLPSNLGHQHKLHSFDEIFITDLAETMFQKLTIY